MNVTTGQIHGAMKRLRESVHFTVIGQCYSLKNSKMARRNGFPIKHPKVRKFQQDFIFQVPAKYRDLKLGSAAEPLRTVVVVFYPSWRQDLSCEAVYDCLQAAGVVANDRFIREKHEFAEVDPKNPRVEIIVEAI